MNQFARFLAAGATAALANWLARFGFEKLMPLTAAIAMAYCLGVLVAYTLNRQFVFVSKAPMLKESVRFIIVNIAALLIVITVTLVLAKLVFPALSFTWHPTAVAHAIGVLSPVILSYLGHRRYTFSDAPSSGSSQS